MKTIQKKAAFAVASAMLSLQNRTRELLKSKRGSGEYTSVIVTVIIVVVAAVVIFWPSIKSWFSTTVMTGLAGSTEGIFDLT